MKYVVISNPKRLEEIKSKISKKGGGNFHVISDFDRTLTKSFINGNKFTSIISLLREGNAISSYYEKKSHELFNKYHPIEVDLKFPLKEKKKEMHEWWTTHFELLIKSGLNKKDLERVVESNKIQFREGCLEFFDFLHSKSIPLIIFSSSGLGDAIPMILKKNRRLYENIHIITNFFEWNKKGNAIKVKEPIIHVMNKDETSVKNYPFFDEIKNRKNVLLLGDSLGDIGMINGFDYANLIKIGFLNEKIDEHLEIYKKNFDVIITDDNSMNYVNKLLKEIIN
ncbi:hypothetical protein J4446_01550 [Candidatus Woesearchaeota archaeon]|nr:hypothetical protein [Candidatus Woesearchaeota archaeon]